MTFVIRFLNREKLRSFQSRMNQYMKTYIYEYEIEIKYFDLLRCVRNMFY